MTNAVSDTAGIARRGEDAIRAALHRDAIAALAASPMPALLEVVDAIRKVLLAADPRALRRSVGWFGLLLGRDIALQAESKRLRSQLGVHVLGIRLRLAEVVAHGEQLARHRQALLEAADALSRHASDLAALLAAAAPEAAGPIASRMQHLATLASGYRVTASHLELTGLNQDELVQRVGRMLPAVELLLDQDRMLRDGGGAQDALQSAIVALQSMPGPDTLPQPAQAAEAAAHIPRNTP